MIRVLFTSFISSMFTLVGGYGKVMKGKPTTELCRSDLAANAAATVQALVGNKSSSISLASTSKRYSIANKSKKFEEAIALENSRIVTRRSTASTTSIETNSNRKDIQDIIKEQDQSATVKKPNPTRTSTRSLSNKRKRIKRDTSVDDIYI